MAEDNERKQDLHPNSKEIEEKIKQMLDPSVPDNPVPQLVKATKSITVQAVSEPTEPTPSAPTITSDAKIPEQTDEPKAVPPSAKKSKKVIIPIDHHEEKAKPDPKAKIQEPAKVKKITITDHNDSVKDVAEKLDQTIAELEPEAKEPAAESEIPSAPELATKEETQPTEPKQAASPEPVPPQLIKSTTTTRTPAPVAETEPPLEEPAVITDPQTDKAVAEIVAAEGDAILAIEDMEREAKSQEQPKKPARKHKSATGKKVLKKLLLIVLPLGLVAAAIAPISRYAVLNAAGVRVTSSLTVVDQTTGQPLKKVSVQLANVNGTTDENGQVKLEKLRLGKTKLTIQKRAYAPEVRNVTLGWGSNPLGSFELKSTGTQYALKTVDFLSSKPVGKVLASTNDADATGDSNGSIMLSIEHPGDKPIAITLKKDGYREEKININPSDTKEQVVTLVPAKKHLYISKASGKFDIYSSYIDGKDRQTVLTGSGKERDDLVLAPHPTANVAAYISTRAGQTNKQGSTLQNLLLIDLSDNQTTSITTGEQIRLISWSSDYLVYAQKVVDAKADASDRYKLISYNHRDGSSKELAKANFFNDVLAIGNTVYYALSSAYQDGSATMAKINADGTNKETVYDKEVWNVFRVSYDALVLSVQQEWYELRIGSNKPTKLNAAPPQQLSRVYIDSPDGKRSAWIDNRDGKGVLVLYDTATKNEKTLQNKTGITYPLHWLNDSVLVYRVKNSQETADYAISIDGGDPVKISNVSNAAGLGRWLD